MTQKPLEPDSNQSRHIDISSEEARREWSLKFDVSEEQLKEAVQAVGARAADVEDHLKGSRATTNSERVRSVLRGDETPQN